MNKYIKLDTAIEHTNELYHGDEVEAWLESLPTIEVSEDCISREWLFKNFQTVCENVICSECPFDDDDCRLADYIKNAPSVVPKAPSEDNKAYTYCSRCGMRVVMDAPSVVPTTEKSSTVGEWKITNTYKDHSGRVVDRVEHTDCGYIWNREMGESLHNFCPNCGAKMKG